MGDGRVIVATATLELATETDAMGRDYIGVTYKCCKADGSSAMAKYEKILVGMNLQVSKHPSPFESVSGVHMDTMATCSASLQDAVDDMRPSMTSSVPEQASARGRGSYGTQRATDRVLSLSPAAVARLLANTKQVPSGENFGNPSKPPAVVTRSGSASAPRSQPQVERLTRATRVAGETPPPSRAAGTGRSWPPCCP